MVGGQDLRREGRRVVAHGSGVAEDEVVAVADRQLIREGAADEDAVAVARDQRIGARQRVGGVFDHAFHQIDRTAVGDDDVVSVADGHQVVAAAKHAEIVAVARADGIVAVQLVMVGGEEKRIARFGVEIDQAAVAEEEIAA